MLPARRRVLGMALGTALAAAGIAGAQPKEQVIKITARKFAFLPGTITLKKGVPATLEFVTADVVMGFNLPDFSVRADIIPGQTAQVKFTPDKTGTFTFLCDIFCGDGHEGMSGTLKVVA
jgi:cytochrome c oxidase subunit 2